VSRFQFVADHRDTFEVKQLCETVEINRSSFYAWEKAAPGRAERAAADAALAARIEVFHKADKTYGAPRITAAHAVRGGVASAWHEGGRRGAAAGAGGGARTDAPGLGGCLAAAGFSTAAP
jgi:hypothetical protein